MFQSYHNLKVVIVDDEIKACSILKTLLVNYVIPDVNIIGIANSTKEAENIISQSVPDVVFMDIEMPNENAFQFLERISPFHFEVIFVTAYDEYAIKALRLNAVDYLLKPISITELKNAVARLIDKLHQNKNHIEQIKPYSEIANEIKDKAKPQKIILKDKNNTEVVYFRDIYFIEAQGSYSKVVFRKNGSSKDITMGWLLTDFEEMLPTDQFFRIHRSYLVNCSHIYKLINEGESYAVLKNDYKLPISRRNHKPLIDFLKINDFSYE